MFSYLPTIEKNEYSRNGVVGGQVDGRLRAVERVVRQRLGQDELEDFLSVTLLLIIIVMVVIVGSLHVVAVQAVDGGVRSQVGENLILILIIVIVMTVVRLGNTVVLGGEEGERTGLVVKDFLGPRDQVDQLGDLRVLLLILVKELPDGQLGIIGLGVAKPFRCPGVGVCGGAADRVVDSLPFGKAEFGNVLGLLSPGESLCRQRQEQERREGGELHIERIV